ncbi:kinesin light chain [Fusarium beomiforme]|uniref:Kinesin light chain n=1 Tax=Fusarium beomiforme TaxID=44412 RepID=A0A9P5AR04_9HYPO|nr:kinesin light chain [Fusarium beomiforme]
MAASYARALLNEIPSSDASRAPMDLNGKRIAILNTLEDKFFGPDQSQKVALVGLSGVPVLSNETADSAYTDITKKLGFQKSSEDDDAKDLVYQHLSSDEAGKWLLIVDNADDQELILGSDEKSGLEEYFPQSKNGIILVLQSKINYCITRLISE